MVYAYIMVRVDAGKEREVMKKLSGLSEVKDSHIIYGEWDLIIKIKSDSIEDITAFVVEKLRKIKQVKLTSTMIAAD
ncbi:MAG: Lrp/AsnC family transcriptional regulator [Candidatus Altiarchaeota archaeon]|nr:Lrp/AsnC family transcriptional regulator [Candidatus Altiarchaeota archaeon]